MDNYTYMNVSKKSADEGDEPSLGEITYKDHWKNFKANPMHGILAFNFIAMIIASSLGFLGQGFIMATIAASILSFTIFTAGIQISLRDKKKRGLIIGSTLSLIGLVLCVFSYGLTDADTGIETIILFFITPGILGLLGGIFISKHI